MEQNPSWKCYRFSASKENACILWKPKLHSRIHKRPSTVGILSHINPVRVSPPYSLKVNFNIILPSKPRLSKWILFLRSSYQNPICTSPVSPTCDMPRPSHSSWFDHPNIIWWETKIKKLPVIYSPPLQTTNMKLNVSLSSPQWV